MERDSVEEELHQKLIDGVVDYDEDMVRGTAQRIVDGGLNAYDAIMNGLSAGMEIVGDLYDNQEYFVPEMLMCADALYAGLNILRPYIQPEDPKQTARGQVIIGSVQGDVHDIGKNIIKIMFEVAGFTVHDLGRDVQLQRFVEEQERTGAKIVAMSAMMTTTMVGMKKVIEMLEGKRPHVAIMIGGAPVTRETATRYGADGYADSANSVIMEANKMISGT